MRPAVVLNQRSLSTSYFVCAAYAIYKTLLPGSKRCPGRPVGPKTHDHPPPPNGAYLLLRWKIVMRIYMAVRKSKIMVEEFDAVGRFFYKRIFDLVNGHASPYPRYQLLVKSRVLDRHVTCA